MPFSGFFARLQREEGVIFTVRGVKGHSGEGRVEGGGGGGGFIKVTFQVAALRLK